MGTRMLKNGRYRIMAAGALIALGCGSAPDERELSLAHFLGPGHTLDESVFTPFSERLAEVSGGRLTVRQFPGGALNSSAPAQYSMLLGGVADIALVVPSYTPDVFPKTDLIGYPHVCVTAVECTDALRRAGSAIEDEYDARVLAIWSNAAPVLLTRDTPVRTLEDMRGLKVRVSSRLHIPFIEALGASAVLQSAPVLHQNMATGVVDGAAVSATGIVAYRLHEPAAYLTTWLPLSGLVFALLMNREVYEGLTAEERGWVDEVADAALSEAGAVAFERTVVEGLELAREAGVEFIDLPASERRRFEQAIADAYEAGLSRPAGDMTVGEVLALFRKE